jgi:hypothetical protein
VSGHFNLTPIINNWHIDELRFENLALVAEMSFRPKNTTFHFTHFRKMENIIKWRSDVKALGKLVALHEGRLGHSSLLEMVSVNFPSELGKRHKFIVVK